MPFELRDVALLLNRLMGPLGFWGFSLGLLGAGISSALTIPLGMVLTLEELYGLREESSRCARQHFRLSEDVESTPRAPAVTAAAPPWVAAAAAAGGAAAGGAQGGDLGKAAREGEGAVVEVGGEGRRRGGAAGGEPGGQRACGAVPSEAVQLEGGYCNDWSTWSRSKRWRMVGRPSVYCFLLLFSLIPSLLRLPTIAIITTAQVANGVLLPIVASALLISITMPPLWAPMASGLSRPASRPASPHGLSRKRRAAQTDARQSDRRLRRYPCRHRHSHAGRSGRVAARSHLRSV